MRQLYPCNRLGNEINERRPNGFAVAILRVPFAITTNGYCGIPVKRTFNPFSSIIQALG